jgi:hypothetical protein
VWLVDSVTTRRASQSWSDLPILGAIRELLFDDEMIANAIELTTWTAREINTLICPCGMEGCSQDGWVAIRCFADHVAILPCFDPESGGRPPEGLGRRGVALLRPPQVETLCSAIGVSAIAHRTTGHDVAGCIRWEAPGAFLGDPFSPIELDDRMVLAAAGVDRRVWASAFREALGAAAGSKRTYAVRPIASEDLVVPVYVDLEGSPGWAPMARRGDAWHLSPLPGFIAEPG